MLEAPWVGRTPEEDRGVQNYEVHFTMSGTVSIAAKNEEAAREIFDMEFTRFDLAEHVEETEINEVY